VEPISLVGIKVLKLMIFITGPKCLQGQVGTFNMSAPVTGADFCKDGTTTPLGVDLREEQLVVVYFVDSPVEKSNQAHPCARSHKLVWPKACTDRPEV